MSALVPPQMDRRMRSTLKAVAGTGAVMAFIAGAFFGGRVGLSVAIGGLVATLNLYALARILIEVIPPVAVTKTAPNRLAWGSLFLVKMLALFAAVWAVVTRNIADPLPLAVGFLSLPIGVAIGSLVSDRTAASYESGQKAPKGPTPPDPV